MFIFVSNYSISNKTIILFTKYTKKQFCLTTVLFLTLSYFIVIVVWPHTTCHFFLLKCQYKWGTQWAVWYGTGCGYVIVPLFSNILIFDSGIGPLLYDGLLLTLLGTRNQIMSSNLSSRTIVLSSFYFIAVTVRMCCLLSPLQW